MSNESSGWISLHRKIQDNFLYPKSRKFTKYEAWISLLLLARHSDEPADVLIDNVVVTCNKGQIIRSIKSYEKEWNWTTQSVRSFFKLLEKQKQITTKGVTKTTILTICNYGDYQHEQQTNNKQVTNRQQTGNKQVTTNNNENNDNNVNNENKNKFSDEIKNFTAEILKNFDNEYCKKLTPSEKWKLVETIDKLIRLDKYTKDQITKAVIFARNDEFWSKQFLSLNKLRKKDKSDVKYIEVFLQKTKTKTSGTVRSKVNDAVLSTKEKFRQRDKEFAESQKISTLNGKSIIETLKEKRKNGELN